ncbi:anhydro-N-acetylmuramic acid kinase [Brachybacterium conglomeratum]|uniref:anhydro-N-acetylmuramic acid kinase n=1 Tax=Brachybacterium conglomeratum TaxID=47846 RepID=UPI0035E9360C
MRVLGMMSGTSLDAIDVALVDFTRDPADPSVLEARLVHLGEEPWPEGTGDALRAALSPAPADVATWNRLHAAVDEAVAAAAARVLAAHGGADLVATHGQTLHHDVRADGTVGGILQIGDAFRLAAVTGLAVLHDLRAADVAAGGQGAPLAPLLDQLLLGHEEPTAALNIGGIANLTLVGGEELVAGDTGAGNALLDAAVHAATGAPADHDAALARQGVVDPAALARLLDAEPFYSRPLPRSTGREHFDAGYVRRVLGDEALAALPLPDLLATLVELTAVTIARAVAPLGARRVVASGGGIRNPLLRARLGAHLDPLPLLDADQLDIPADGKEALLIALLGHHGAHGLPGTLALPDGTAHTGARTPVVLGSLTPPHRSPAAHAAPADGLPVRRLRLVPEEGR